MNKNRMAMASLSIMSAFLVNPAFALDLYVDNDTQQIYATPGANRVKLGSFEKKEDMDKLKATLKAEIEAELKSKPQLQAEKQENTPKVSATLNTALVDDVNVPQAQPKERKGYTPANISYGKNGFEFRTDDDKFSLAIQNRIQARFAEPFDGDPRTLADLDKDEKSFMIRRARTKLNGHAYVPWLKYYLQYDWSQPVLRDLNLTIDKYKWAQVRVGRGKVSYNNERVTSSGNQQFVNRSIVNDIFTVDRQQGIEVKGNLFPGKWYDMTYYAGAFTGLGVGERNNDDGNMMYSGRLQWNALGGEMKFSQSDIEFSEHPALNISVAANSNRSKCTAFETDSRSCRSLTDLIAPNTNRYRDPSKALKDGGPKSGQYEISQMMEEVHFKWKGFSFLQELHAKRIKDTLNNDEETKLLGGFVQAGYFPHRQLDFIPKNLEIAGRYAFVDMDTDRDYDKQTELSAVINYFLEGHFNKLSLQLSRLSIEDPIKLEKDAETRVWAQWDFSF
ncbi:MAG: porin [Methylotenera sp.]|uniref:porin n=1 Tax=Methylotenera sp. TaxID=2051956 RepID=UPI0027269747|nr:porin [Methylotenera sp.]MDO9152051.1 porin [Methylotenera sp.]